MRAARAIGPLGHLRHQQGALDRLGDVVVHPAVQAALDFRPHRVGGEREDRQIGLPAAERADLTGGGHAVLVRHAQIHQDQRRFNPGDLLHRFLSVMSHVHLGA